VAGAGDTGAATGRSLRALTREYLDDPAAFLARRRGLATGDRGAVDLAAFRRAHGTGAEWLTDSTRTVRARSGRWAAS
jgi:hypothetical protein